MMDLLLLLLHVLLQILLLPSPTDMETLNLVMPNKGAYTNACRKVACTVTNQKNALAISTETSASSLSSNSNGNIAADRMTLTVHNAMADTCRRNLLLGKLNIQMVLRPTILALGTNIARMRGKDVMDGRTTAGRGTAACGMYQGCLPMCYPLPKWVMGNGFWWMGGLPITLPIQVWAMGNTLPITHFGLSRMGNGWVMTCSTGYGDSYVPVRTL